MTMEQAAPMTVAVFGLGYVGCVSAACLARLGHRVIGLDVNEHKVRLIQDGKPTIVERDIGELVASGRRSGRLMASTDIKAAVQQADVCLVCVGTPSDPKGFTDLSYIHQVANQIGEAIGEKEGFLVVAIRSTVPPGTCREVEHIIARSGKQPGDDFTVVSNPEFLREGSSVADYFSPPFTLVGSDHRAAIERMRQLYAGIDAPFIETERTAAEMIKYVNNSFHALKVVFANEVGMICQAYGVDSHKVMELFCMDRQLNISPAYLKPGFAFGGSCLPKDLRAMAAMARAKHIDAHVLSVIERSNELMVERAVQMVLAEGVRKIGVIGLSFKEGTDDLRESPVIKLVERLIGKGHDIRIYDRHVAESRLIGANRQYMEQSVPNLSKLLVSDLSELQPFAELVIVSQRSPEYAAFGQELLARNIPLLDLVRLYPDPPRSPLYKGIVW